MRDTSAMRRGGRPLYQMDMGGMQHLIAGTRRRNPSLQTQSFGGDAFPRGLPDRVSSTLRTRKRRSRLQQTDIEKITHTQRL